MAIDYGYREFPKGTNQTAALTKILDDAWTQDLRYLTNQDIDTNPRADQWSNGVNQADELNRIMKIRRAALDRIGENTIRTGAAMATIEEPLVPIYMYHRYAVESRVVNGRGAGFYLRDARRWADAGEVGVGGESAQGAGCAGCDVETFGTYDSEKDSRCDSAASAGIWIPSRTVSANDRDRRLIR